MVFFAFKLNHVENDYGKYAIISETLLSPSVQAIGICFFKSSMDPLANFSTLYYHKIVSIN